MACHLFLLAGFMCDEETLQKCAVVKPIFLCICGHFLKVVSALNILRKWHLKVNVLDLLNGKSRKITER